MLIQGLTAAPRVTIWRIVGICLESRHDLITEKGTGKVATLQPYETAVELHQSVGSA